MKKLSTIIVAIGLCGLFAAAQDQSGVNSPEKNPKMVEVTKFLRTDKYERPYTSMEIQNFVDFIEKNPITNGIENDERVPRTKIDLAQDLYDYTKDPADKKKLVNILMKTLRDIQVLRDKLGINPSPHSEERWLYITPKPLPGEDTQAWTNRATVQINKQIKDIESIENIYRDIYETLTEKMKIKLEGIPKLLERSPEEKARTKDMLEKRAAAAGHKKPEPEAPVVETK